MNSDLAAQQALDQLAKVGFEELDPVDQILAAVWTFEADVGNRGFARYFNSAAGDMAYRVPAALKTIGAVEMADIAFRANNVFGTGGPPRDRTRRRALVGSLDEEARTALQNLETKFYQSDEDVDDLLEAYLDKHRR